MTVQIDHALEEIRRFRPSPEFAAQAVADERLYEDAAADRLGFWADQARELLHWEHAVHADARLVEPAVRQVVRRRRAQRRRTTASTATSRPATATASPSTGRASPATAAPSPTPS